MRVLCDVCFRGGDTNKSALPVSVRSGQLRINTWLCGDCSELADDAQEVETVIEMQTEPEPTPQVTWTCQTENCPYKGERWTRQVDPTEKRLLCEGCGEPVTWYKLNLNSG